MPSPPVNRPTPSGPSARARNPPITAVGMKRARSGRDQRRISAAAGKDEREDYERQTEIFSAAEHAHPSGWMSHSQTRSQRGCRSYRRNQPADCRRPVRCLTHTTSRGCPVPCGVEWEMAAIEATEAEETEAEGDGGGGDGGDGGHGTKLQKRRHGDTEVTLKLAFRSRCRPGHRPGRAINRPIPVGTSCV